MRKGYRKDRVDDYQKKRVENYKGIVRPDSQRGGGQGSQNEVTKPLT